MFTQHCGVVKSIRCFQRHLFVCLFVCLFVDQHDDFQTSKHRMMKLGGRCIVQKSRPSLNSEVIAPVSAPPNMWRWATTLGKSAQAVSFSIIFSSRQLLFFLQCYSACMFNSSIDVLITSGLGCHVDGIRVGFMMYTDD